MQTAKQFNRAVVEVAGKLGFVWMPFNLNPNEACGNYGFNCPVAEKQKESLQISLPVQRTWPKISLDVRLKLVDEKSNLIFCIVFPAKLQDSNQRRPRLN